MADQSAASVKVPDKFFGTFKLERSENFDEFLASKGVNWLLRKMINFTSVTKVIAPSDGDKNSYKLWNLSSKKNTMYDDWKLKEPFEGEGMDGKMHRIIFDFDPSAEQLKETHIRTDDPSDVGETYIYEVDGNTLILNMANDTVSCKRFFSRQPEAQ